MSEALILWAMKSLGDSPHTVSSGVSHCKNPRPGCLALWTIAHETLLLHCSHDSPHTKLSLSLIHTYILPGSIVTTFYCFSGIPASLHRDAYLPWPTFMTIFMERVLQTPPSLFSRPSRVPLEVAVMRDRKQHWNINNNYRHSELMYGLIVHSWRDLYKSIYMAISPHTDGCNYLIDNSENYTMVAVHAS